MSTNYYLRKKLTSEESREIFKFIKSKYEEFDSQVIKNIYGIEYALDDFIYEVKEFARQYINEIHIGKRSYGWQFLWDYHGGKYYRSSLEDIKKFLSNPDYEIVDEYGETYTFEQFFNEKVGKSLYEGKNGLEEGLSSHFFISDGLRFSSHEDFS